MVERHLGPEKPDAAVALRDDLFGHDPTRSAMGNAHAAVDGLPIRIHDLHHRDPGAGHHGARGLRMFEARDDDTGWPPREHLEEDLLFLFRQVVRHAHNRLQVAIFQHLADPGEHFGKDHVAEAGDDDRDEVHALGGERSRDLVRDVAKLLGRFADLLAGRLAHVALVAQNAADGHLAHARGL